MSTMSTKWQIYDADKNKQRVTKHIHNTKKQAIAHTRRHDTCCGRVFAEWNESGTLV